MAVGRRSASSCSRPTWLSPPRIKEPVVICSQGGLRIWRGPTGFRSNGSGRRQRTGTTSLWASATGAHHARTRVSVGDDMPAMPDRGTCAPVERPSMKVLALSKITAYNRIIDGRGALWAASPSATSKIRLSPACVFRRPFMVARWRTRRVIFCGLHSAVSLAANATLPLPYDHVSRYLAG